MPKIYKLNNKLVLNVPFEVISALDIKEGEEVDFLKYKDNSFLFAKKSDLVGILTGERAAARPAATEPFAFAGEIDNDELRLLKKLDTLRYNERTKAKVTGMLDQDEKAVLQRLLKKRAVTLFQKSPDQEPKFGISKGVYNQFLFGKRDKAGTPPPAQPQQAPQPKKWEVSLKGDETNLTKLEAEGYIVLSNEAEATALSVALEDSIKRGAVLGTRAFNRKFYVVMRSFMIKNAPKIIKALDKKALGISEIAKACDIAEDAARAILYMMSESGEISEVRRDNFRLV
jgi:hypothetical protein